MKNRVHETVVLAGRTRHWSFKPKGKSKIVRPGDAKWINL